jgi:hypothetical protein
MLQTKWVFLDTEVFVAHRFMFESGPLKRLADLSAAGTVHLVITDTTVREVRKKIEDQVHDTCGGIEKKLAGAPAVRGLIAPALLNALDAAALRAQLFAKLDEFLNTSKAERLPHSDEAAKQVLDDYFDGEPPFGKGDKKHQFLDAIALKSLLLFAQDEGIEVYVVSRDPDVKSVCDGEDEFIRLEELSGVLTLVEIADQKALDVVVSATSKIKQRVIEEVERAGFYIEQDGDVENVEVVDVEVGDLKVQKVDDGVVEFAGSARVTVRADVSYGDPDTASYDHEDGLLIYHHQVEKRIEDEFEFQILGSVTARDENLDAVEDVLLDGDPMRVFTLDTSTTVYDDREPTEEDWAGRE